MRSLRFIFCLWFLCASTIPSALAQAEVTNNELLDTGEEVEEALQEEVVEEEEEEEIDLDGLSREEQERIILDRALAERPESIPVNLQNNVSADGSFLVQPGSFFDAANPGDVMRKDISILNKLGEDAIYEIHVRDFGTNPEGGSPRFYQPWQAGPFPAKDWITPAVTEIALRHGEMATIPVRIDIPEKADVGDHMAAVLIKRKRLTEVPGGVKVNSYTSILYIVTVRGEVETGGELLSLSPAAFLQWNLPIQVTATAKNTGTVHFASEGKLIFRNVFGIVVDEIPLPSWHVLRGNTHNKKIIWRPDYAFGYYTVESDITFKAKSGAPIEVQQQETSFLIIPLIPTLLIILAIFVVSFLVQYFFNRFEIKRKV